MYETDSQRDLWLPQDNRLVVANMEGCGRGKDWEFGISYYIQDEQKRPIA